MREGPSVGIIRSVNTSSHAMQSRPATVDLHARGKALQPLHVWTEVLYTRVSCNKMSFLHRFC